MDLLKELVDQMLIGGFKMPLPKKRKDSISNSPHGTVNNLNISHLRINQDMNYYQTHNTSKINQDGNSEN